MCKAFVAFAEIRKVTNRDVQWTFANSGKTSRRFVRNLRLRVAQGRCPDASNQSTLCHATFPFTYLTLAPRLYRHAHKRDVNRGLLVCGMTNSLNNIHALVCDDAVENRHEVSALLTKLGGKVTQTENGRQAVHAVSDSSTAFDLVLINMRMPVMDGYAATRAIRELGFTGPVIAFVALTMPGDRQRCRDAGCTAFLPKPLQMGVMLQTVLHVLPSRTHPASTTQSDAIPDFVSARASTVASPRNSPMVHSTMSNEEPRFRARTTKFVEKLAMRMNLMQHAFDSDDAPELVEHAFWLKHAAATVGFDCFTAPATAIYEYAVAGNASATQPFLVEIRRLMTRIELPWDIPPEASATRRSGTTPTPPVGERTNRIAGMAIGHEGSMQ